LGGRSDGFIQNLLFPKLSFYSLQTKNSPVKVIVPEDIESNIEWLEQKSAGSFHSPFSGISHSIFTIVLTHSFPGIAHLEKNLLHLQVKYGSMICDNLSPEDIHINPFSRKKSRRGQKASSITIVIDTVHLLFLSFNIGHKVSIVAFFLEFFTYSRFR
jgi:hypothetical protein